MAEKVVRCAIYIRVSTAEQAIHGKSLAAQREYLAAYAAEHHMQVMGIFADEGKTARKNLKNRKAIKDLLEHVKRNEIDVILFWKMDRWFRNVSDFYKVQDILDAHHTRWIAAAEPNMSLDTRDGRLNLNIYLSIGQNEVDTTSERIKFAAESIINKGGLIYGEYNMPLGYTKGLANGKKAMVIDEATSTMVHDAFDYLITHQSKRGTVNYIQNKYDYNFTYAMLDTMCHSELYIGKCRNNYSYCPAYLTQEQYLAVQEINKKNVKQPRTGRIYLFSGLIICPFCQCRFGGYAGRPHLSVKTNEIKTYQYYRCYSQVNCTKPHDFHIQIGEKTLERYLLNNLSHEFDKYQHSCRNITDAKPASPAKDPEKIKQSMNRLSQLYIKGRISEEDYEEQYADMQKQYNEIALTPKPAEKSYAKIKSILASDFQEMYESLTESNKQAFWRGIIEEIHIDKNKNVSLVKFIP